VFILLEIQSLSPLVAPLVSGQTDLKPQFISLGPRRLFTCYANILKDTLAASSYMHRRDLQQLLIVVVGMIL